MEEEILDVVDDKDSFVRKASRKEVMENALMHRKARVILIQSNNHFLVQKRSINKEVFPEHWDIGVLETVTSGESYEGAAIRGLMEELSITGISNIEMMHSFLFKLKYNSQETNEQCKVYKILYDGKIKIQEEEVEDIKFLTEHEVKNLIENYPFHPVGATAFKRYLELKDKNVIK